MVAPQLCCTLFIEIWEEPVLFSPAMMTIEKMMVEINNKYLNIFNVFKFSTLILFSILLMCVRDHACT